ncbi:hypothetical protein MIND_00499400 [Mycena indigotica]|uniref:Conserved oligomeric Golgi complex subunit 1 n=1 Tax=Mycena indigotica TaxID=2126181 RepID=A0A8H6SW79_9AGAR|nr:uncharacterized protein MIND_00499400 [Mycena indigotica]KAF7307063.1 hypothetical protein MIND_00499400 [Mycena indigotica]
MSRRPSQLSISSPGPLLNGSAQATQSPVTQEAAQRPLVGKLAGDSSEMDPDMLFTKCTIAEVKIAKDKLRADADAKQEELRLMVGERYRDLLQASTSIVSISHSSNRVIEALGEAKDAILSQRAPPLPQRVSSYGGGDTHLHALQLLSAHIKLLLDAPEYLWRLMERKKYFTAAWLFLLARVVHRALDRNDEQEESWKAAGIDVKAQFPLIQRQWDTVAPLRASISHRALASLRESSTPSAEVCAALLTLHLLDSRPLSETLPTFLSQRSKTFASLLLRGSENSSNSPLSPPIPPRANGHILDKRPPRKGSVREVKEAVQTALNTVIKTLASSRDVFEATESRSSMIRSALEYMQSDIPNSDSFNSLPPDLRLTTQSLLASLPSSTHFLLLPADLRTYRPYADLTSASTAIDRNAFKRLIGDWFKATTESLQLAISRWFLELHTVAEVWSLRGTIRQWILVSDLLPDEINALLRLFDNAAQKRVLSIWNLELSDAGDAFHMQLTSATASLRNASTEDSQAASPIHFLFDSPPLPVLTGFGPNDSSFQKYKASLCRQLLGRTAILDGVLSTLENCARSLQRDLSLVLGGKDEDSRLIASKLSDDCRSDAEEVCKAVIETLSTAVRDQEKDNSDLAVQCLVFIGRVADELAFSSPFFTDVGCASSVVQENKIQLQQLHGRITDRWRTSVVSRLIKKRKDSLHPLPKSLIFRPSAPSSILLETLSHLSTSLQELGLSRSKQDIEAEKTLRHFIQEWVVVDGTESEGQRSCDIGFLRRLADLRMPEWQDVCQLLDKEAEQLQRKIQKDERTANGSHDRSDDQLASTQTLFAALLPLQSPMRMPEATDKSAALLPFGTPLDQPFESLLEFGDQSTRFGMLLVEIATH